MRGTVRLSDDALAADNAFNFVVSPAEPVRITLVDRGSAASALYLTRALAIGEAPRFETVIRQPDALSDDDLRRSAVVVLNDVAVGAPLGAPARALRRAGRRAVRGHRAARALAAGRRRAAGARSGRRRSHARRRGARRRARVRASGVRAVPRAAQRRLLVDPVYGYRTSTAAGAQVLARFDAARRRCSSGASGRPRAALGVDARSVVERPADQARLPAVRPPADPSPGGLHGAAALAHRRAGARTRPLAPPGTDAGARASC